jgi:hypothetical protein
MKRVLWLACTVFASACPLPAKEPSLFREKPFTAVTFAEAVNHFVTIGETAAVKELHELASRESTGLNWRNERIGWMCRVLFEAKGSEPLRPPRFGKWAWLPEEMPAKNWPLCPVARSGPTFFVLSEGYILFGVAEDTNAYIDYCRANGTFRKIPVTVPSRAQALDDAAALRRSDAWKAIPWRTESHFISEEGVWKSIQDQADTIAPPKTSK